ncbi:hypothetical protein NQ176_g6639 [Zarea fungicola]|uniref:Uncharacterized protein n=1 Tax=Zarea fungicola TaxID=93591 RepID=A0ACC1N437_9HYPO|nr:hypothetical protein NQ176_g6639 [Lecanicillium fungicola]
MAGVGVQDHMVVGPDDHRAYIVIAATVGLTWSILVLLIRLFIRLRIAGPFGWDDTFAVIATFIGSCQTAVVLYAAREGLGVRHNEGYLNDVESALKAYFASTLMYIAAICPAKASMSLLISRVSRQAAGRHSIATNTVTGLIFAWGISSIFTVAFQCGSSRPWDIVNGHCTGVFQRWITIESLSVVLEVLISALAFSLVLGFDMAFRTKFIVVAAFSAQLLVAIPVSFRLIYLRDALRAEPTTTTTANTIEGSSAANDATVLFTVSKLTIATQAVMHFSIMAATFPCFRQFLQAFNNNFGATTKMGTDEAGGGSRSQGITSNNSYAMSTLRAQSERRFGGSAQTTRNHDSDTDVEAVYRPIATCQEGLSTHVDDERSLEQRG